MSLFDLITQSSIKLGLDPVSSLTADTVEVEAWAATWEPVLLRCLSAHPWTFGTATQELSRLLTTPADPRFKYEFDFPSDFLSARYWMDQWGCRTDEYRTEGKRFLSNHERIIAVYGRTYGQDDVAELPSWFCDFYVSSLANENAEKLVGIGTVKQAIQAETGILFNKAKIRDAHLAPPVRIGNSRWRAMR